MRSHIWICTSSSTTSTITTTTATTIPTNSTIRLLLLLLLLVQSADDTSTTCTTIEFGQEKLDKYFHAQVSVREKLFHLGTRLKERRHHHLTQPITPIFCPVGFKRWPADQAVPGSGGFFPIAKRGFHCTQLFIIGVIRPSFSPAKNGY